MSRSDETPDVSLDAIREALTDLPIRLAVVYGSTIRGTAGPHSDVDVAVEFHKGISQETRHRARLHAIVELSRALGTDEVDVADIDGLRPEVGASALGEGCVVLGDPDRAERLRERFAERAPTRTDADRRKQFDQLLTEMEEAVDG